ncbi:MAG: virulence RhuM family protein [Candidatus Electrothrix aestuarii]|uniref:Virulence RhuM family protein n=1 Tax=Candidatus Electrothrix aestuarii TaxID=3062594 RepID=A0AAU8M233_9BACT|nr:virulence RhuM family protein [Candidatus Electrothrix aestuarii]
METSDIIIYKTHDGKSSVALYAQDGNVWLNQKQLAELFDTSKPNISMHIANVLEEGELSDNSVVKDFLTTAADGKQYKVRYYALPMILAVGFRVRSIRGTQFRQWANRHLHEYMVKGFLIDDERLKNPDGRPDYFDEMLERIRDIRASEKRFYQKVRDLFALSSDYESSDKATQMFFSEVQNKLLFAVTEQTAAEIIVSRASAEKNNMGLTSWKGSVVRKQDIYIAKNYLSADEIDTLNRLVVIFLETAELRAKRRIDTTMDFWRQNVDQIIQSNDFALLENKGSISKKRMEHIALAEYGQFDERRKAYEAELADLQDEEELRLLESRVKGRKRQGE